MSRAQHLYTLPTETLRWCRCSRWPPGSPHKHSYKCKFSSCYLLELEQLREQMFAKFIEEKSSSWGRSRTSKLESQVLIDLAPCQIKFPKSLFLSLSSAVLSSSPILTHFTLFSNYLFIMLFSPLCFEYFWRKMTFSYVPVHPQSLVRCLAPSKCDSRFHSTN